MQLLTQRTWRDIRLTALAHGMRFDTNQTKQEGRRTVHNALLKEGGLRRAYRRLSAKEREALAMLQLHHAVLPLSRFVAHFGPIRPHKPWRDPDSRFFWKRPASTAEKLWHLALIEIRRGGPGQPDSVHLPDEVAALLPPLPRPVSVSAAPTAPDQHARGVLLRDLAALLSGLLAGEGRWWRGRLTPRSLRRLNRRLQHREDLSAVRSEQQAHYIRWLRYLLHAAGLLADGQPTPAAWLWLDAPDAWDQLADAIRLDLNRRESLWARYGLPPVSAQVWTQLLALLADLSPGRVYSRDSLYAPLRFDVDRATFDTLLETVLVWGGWVNLSASTVRATSHEVRTEPARLVQQGQALYVDLPPVPPLRPLVEVSTWAHVDAANALRLDADAVRRALEQGHQLTGIIRALADLTGGTLPQSATQQIRVWAQAAQTVQLRTLTVLTVTDPAIAQRIRADWRLRPLMGESLSPQHIVVQSSQADALRRKLSRRGYPVTSAAAEAPALASSPPAEYVYLAFSVYRQLGRFVPLAIRVPPDIVDSARRALPPERVTAMNQAALQIVNGVRQVLTGFQVARGGVAQDDPAHISEAIEAAQRQCAAITIRYYSPYSGEETRRTIEPHLIYERNGARYVEAWCQLEQDTRTFRIDRIMAISETTTPRAGPGPDDA